MQYLYNTFLKTTYKTALKHDLYFVLTCHIKRLESKQELLCTKIRVTSRSSILETIDCDACNGI